MKSLAEIDKINLILNAPDDLNDGVVGAGAVINSETISFLQKVADCKPRHNRECASLRINFVGKDPLLCFELIKNIVERMDRANVDWTLATSGSHISPEKVDFFNKQRVKVVLSFGGAADGIVCAQDVLINDTVIKSLKTLDRLGVEVVVTALSQDIYKNLEQINKIFGNTIEIEHKFLKLSGGVPDALLEYDLNRWRNTCALMADAALNQFKTHARGWESDWYWRSICLVYDFLDGTNRLCSCSIRRKELTLDASGGIWYCVNGVHSIGNVKSVVGLINDHSEKTVIRLYQENKQFCGNCRWFPFCHGHCPRETNSEQQQKQCAFLGIFYESVAWVMKEFDEFTKTQARGNGQCG